MGKFFDVGKIVVPAMGNAVFAWNLWTGRGQQVDSVIPVGEDIEQKGGDEA